MPIIIAIGTFENAGMPNRESLKSFSARLRDPHPCVAKWYILLLMVTVNFQHTQLYKIDKLDFWIVK